MTVTKYNWKVGDKVVRGRDWRYGTQDYHKGEPALGVIEKGYGDGNRLLVRWQSGYAYCYRVGADNCYDLEFYKPKRNDPLNLL